MLENQISLFEDNLNKILDNGFKENEIEELGIVYFIDNGIAKIKGLEQVKYQELVCFENGTLGMAFNLDSEEIGIIILGDYEDIRAGSKVKRTYKVAGIPVSKNFIGRVINPLGEPLDGKGKIKEEKRIPIERKAPPIMDRAPVNRPLQTGLKVIDSIVPIGRGQRELILGDRQTGKTAIAIDTIINQKDKNVICIYCAIGQKTSSVAKVIETLRRNGAMEYTIIVLAESSSPPGVAYIAPYSATTLGEYFMEQGKDVLIVYDDLTKHAISYRELSLLLERPPGREAYPGDIFYIHSRLLERATQLKSKYGGGSLTALPIAEIQKENISSYIPTNLISITDGQIYLSSKLFEKGNMPSVKIGVSVSRIGGKTQLPAYRKVTSDLKLIYSQFEELEAFESFSSSLDENTKKTLARGKRIRAVLNQDQYMPMDVSEQIGILLAVTNGLLDWIPLEKIKGAESVIREVMRKDEELDKKIKSEKDIAEEDKKRFLEEVEKRLQQELRS